MTDPNRLSGVLAPVLTPLDARLRPDHPRLLAHCRWLLDAGLSLAPLGTTSEANSLALDDRMAVLSALVDDGIEPARILAGGGSCALREAAELSQHAVGLNCAGVLLLPPFYYKAVSDDGLFGWVSELISAVGDPRLRIYLYHIPPIAQVGFSADLIERLIRAYPGIIAGLKDSSGDWSNTLACHDRGWDDFRIFVGSEKTLLDNLRAGGAGCISATANVNPGGLQRLLQQWRDDAAPALNEQALAIRSVFEEYPVIPALKATIARWLDDEEWLRTCPPLVPMPADQRSRLAGWLTDLGLERH